MTEGSDDGDSTQHRLAPNNHESDPPQSAERGKPDRTTSAAGLWQQASPFSHVLFYQPSATNEPKVVNPRWALKRVLARVP